MTNPDYLPPEVEHQHHDYTGNEIPWYVRLIWIGFWKSVMRDNSPC